MFDQTGFDRVVRDYNRDYMLLLTRASRRHYDCLISSFLVLRDLYNVIQVLYDSGNYTYSVLPYPFSFRSDDQLLKQLGYATHARSVFEQALAHARRFKLKHEEEQAWVSVAKKELAQ